MEKILSLVVPVYNIQDYLKDLVASLETQDLAPNLWEILFVNDGSTDESLKVGQLLTKKIDNARWISQENKGVSEARNVGLREAQGKFVWFVDADDFISKNILLKIKHFIDSYPTMDVLTMSQMKFTENGAKEYTVKYDTSELPCSGVEHMQKKESFTQVAIYAFCRSFLLENNLFFYPDIYHEDEEFYSRVFFFAKKVVYMPNIASYYRIREGSIMNSNNKEKRVDDLLKILVLLLDFSKKNKAPISLVRSRPICFSILNMSLENKLEKQGQSFFSLLKKEALVRNAFFKSLSFERQLFFKILLLFPSVLSWKIYKFFIRLL